MSPWGGFLGGRVVAKRDPLFVERLNSRKRAQLKRRIRSAENMKYRDRCRAILWSADGKTISEIAELLTVHRTTVYRWVKDYVRFGLDGLEIVKQTGRPRKADQ